MWLIEVKKTDTTEIFNCIKKSYLQIGKQYLAEDHVAGTYLVNKQYVIFPEEVKIIGRFKEQLNYKYTGKDAVEVVVFQFYDRGDYILSLKQFIDLGMFDHIFVDNEIEQSEVKQILWGKMSERQFNSLEAWEG